MIMDMLTPKGVALVDRFLCICVWVCSITFILTVLALLVLLFMHLFPKKDRYYLKQGCSNSNCDLAGSCARHVFKDCCSGRPINLFKPTYYRGIYYRGTYCAHYLSTSDMEQYKAL